ncbi:MAG: DUF2760 domain-containing protein [Thermodesulfobacteriota bacterium]
MKSKPSIPIKGTVIGSWIFLFLLFGLLLFVMPYWIGKQLPTAIPNDGSIQALEQFTDWFLGFQKQMWLYGIPAIAIVTILWALWFHGAVQKRTLAVIRPVSSDRKAGKAVFPSSDGDEKAAPARDPNVDKRLFLHLIGLLQREGRLLDFLQENLEDYEDAQIGAAVRNIHENCRKVVLRYLPLQPVVNQEEGETITLQADFDATAVKLMGQVGGSPPFTGVVRHRGWKVKKVVLPELSGTQNPDILVPAEVEIS